MVRIQATPGGVGKERTAKVAGMDLVAMEVGLKLREQVLDDAGH